MTAGYLLMIPESPVMHRALFKCARVNKWREQCAFQSAGVSVLQMCPWLGPQCRHLLKITVVSTGTARSPPPRTPAPEPRELRARILHQCIGGSPGWGAGGRAGLGPPGAGLPGAGREKSFCGSKFQWPPLLLIRNLNSLKPKQVDHLSSSCFSGQPRPSPHSIPGGGGEGHPRLPWPPLAPLAFSCPRDSLFCLPALGSLMGPPD